MKWYYWIGWILFILSCIGDGYFFIVDYKKPISLDNEADAAKIMYVLQEEHDGCVIKDIHLGGNFPITGLFKDLIEYHHPNSNIESVKSVSYVVETDTTTYHYVSLFEVEHNLFKEQVGKKLLTGRNYFFGLAK